MGWRLIGESRRFDSDDNEIREAYEEGCKKGYKKAMKEFHEREGYGEREDWDDMDDDDDDDDSFGERGGYGGGGSYGMRGGYGGGGYGERRGVRGTGPYSRVTRAGYVRRGYRRRY